MYPRYRNGTCSSEPSIIASIQFDHCTALFSSTWVFVDQNHRCDDYGCFYFVSKFVVFGALWNDCCKVDMMLVVLWSDHIGVRNLREQWYRITISLRVLLEVVKLRKSYLLTCKLTIASSTYCDVSLSIPARIITLVFFLVTRHISYLPLAHIYERMNMLVMLHHGTAVGFYQGVRSSLVLFVLSRVMMHVIVCSHVCCSLWSFKLRQSLNLKLSGWVTEWSKITKKTCRIDNSVIHFFDDFSTCSNLYISEFFANVCNYPVVMKQDILKLMDDMETLKPTVFASVPRLYNRIYDKWVHLWKVLRNVKRILEKSKLAERVIYSRNAS